MKNIYAALSLLLITVSCSRPVDPTPMGTATPFFPPVEVLRRGIVHKYYLHYQSDDQYRSWTDISYSCYLLNPEGHLEVTVFNPAFEPMMRTVTAFQEGRQVVLAQEQYSRQDTLPVALQQAALLNWQGATATYYAETFFPSGLVEGVRLRQLSQTDSLVDGRQLKIFHKERQQTYSYPDGGGREYQSEITDIYASGLGLYERELKLAEGQLRVELVEQFSVKSFRKRRAAVPPRVAYIDPRQVLDKDGDFVPCGADIYDYYNGEPDAGPRAGKRALLRYLEQELDASLLSGASGYLTFRFVINCEGEAGYFITEEAKLDFERQQFSLPLVQQVYALLRDFKAWQPTVVRGEAVDAYAYVTLKLNDGQLIDILP